MASYNPSEIKAGIMVVVVLAAFTALSRENPQRVAAIAGPSSDIAKALVGELKRLPSREETKRIEDKNRERLLAGVMR